LSALATHLDDLLAVLRASAGLGPAAGTAATLRVQLAARLDPARPDLAARVRGLDDWHAEALADFITDAHVVATALEHPPARGARADDTRAG
jgi:hypothetical protein